ncbi:MAG: peptide-methionine (S)-S-oxide reductase MsrA [Oleispira sp.]|nr:peptide-methionine (S)-S-oxide reductase MsrA [Oleispira sp.]MBL4880786.1 peptide-methionine (S)-S-oxide reductase MsrA [Oleispira sp.]
MSSSSSSSINAMPHAPQHFVSDKNVDRLPEGMEYAMFGLGCFWGAERKFWQLEGVYITSVGYTGGNNEHPTYNQVCSGITHHNEIVRLVYNPDVISYQKLLEVFWLAHNPTQGDRQGNDKGTQYRSGIYTFSDQQLKLANESKEHFQKVLSPAGFGNITTEIITAPAFYFAEDYHQQYLAKEPNGYCGLGGLNLTY